MAYPTAGNLSLDTKRNQKNYGLHCIDRVDSFAIRYYEPKCAGDTFILLQKASNCIEQLNQ